MASLLALLMIGFFLVAPSPVAGAENYYIEFWTDRTQIYPGECINIYWDTHNVQTVYYNNQPVSGIAQTRLECPAYSTIYNLLVTTRDGQKINKQIYVQVSNSPPSWNNWNNNMIIDFWTDRAQIQAGECVNVYWNTNNVQTVHYNGRPVSGIQQRRVECPDQSTTYELLVMTRNNQPILKQVHIQVFGDSFDRGEIEMYTGEGVDFDEEGRVAANGDDFRWIWIGAEEGVIVKADDDRDLRLALVGEGSADRFDRLSQTDCQEQLDDDDRPEIEVEQESIVCLRTDEGDYGKFWIEDIRYSNGRLELDWYIWK